MAVVKRGNTWQIDYIDPAGKRIRKSFKTKKEAVSEHAKRVSLIAEGRYLDVKKACKTTFGELLKKYKENFEQQRSFKNWKELCLKNFEAYFGKETRLANIPYMEMETYRNHLKQKMTHKKTIRTDAAVNREMSCFHHLFSKAVEWDMIEQSPFTRGKTLLVKENNSRLRYLTEDEITRLLAVCTPHLKDIVTTALNTGMRRGEILTLKWDQVKGDFIYLQHTKTDTPRQIPINETLAQLFKEIKKRQRIGTESVFLFSPKAKKKTAETGLYVVNPETGHPVNNVKHSFTTALKRAKIEDFRFHDLRHTFASHMIMRGASLKELQEILGHKTMSMTLRYAHLSAEHKKKAVNLLNGLTASNSQPSENAMSQNVTNGDLVEVANG